MNENLTKREVTFFATKLQNGKNTPVLALFIPDVYDHGTVVTDVFDPNFTKIDNWADTINKAIEKLEKVATTTTPGRVIIGDGLVVDEEGNVEHSTEIGYKHIPTGGKINQYLKWLNNGNAQWADLDINLDDYYNKTETDEKFKNFCPFKVGDIYLTTNSTNPSSIFLGTTWQKIEGRFLLGTSGSGASKATGGSNSKTISQANLPNVKLTVNSFSLSRGTQNITGTLNTRVKHGSSAASTGAFTDSSTAVVNLRGGEEAIAYNGTFDASKSWTGSTNSASPQTSTLGNGQALDITPAYYTVHMWLRLT